MDILHNNYRVIISTQNDLRRMNEDKNKIIDKDNKMVIYDYLFGMHQDCICDFADNLGYEFYNPNDISRSGNIIIFIAGPHNNKYDLIFYLPENIEDYQLSFLESVINTLNDNELSFLCISKGNKNLQYTENRIDQFREFIIDNYQSKLIS